MRLKKVLTLALIAACGMDERSYVRESYETYEPDQQQTD